MTIADLDSTTMSIFKQSLLFFSKVRTPILVVLQPDSYTQDLQHWSFVHISVFIQNQSHCAENYGVWVTCYKHLYVYKYLCVYKHLYVYKHLCVYKQLYVYKHLCVYKHQCVYKHLCVYKQLCVYKHLYVYVLY